MKTLLKIAIVAILAFFAFSCKKEEEPIVYKTFEHYGVGVEALSANDLAFYYNTHLQQPIVRYYNNAYYPYPVMEGAFGVSDTFYSKGSYWRHTQEYMLDSAIMKRITVRGQNAMLTISNEPETTYIKDVPTTVNISLNKDWLWRDKCYLPVGWNSNGVLLDIYVVMYAHTTGETNTKID